MSDSSNNLTYLNLVLMLVLCLNCILPHTFSWKIGHDVPDESDSSREAFRDVIVGYGVRESEPVSLNCEFCKCLSVPRPLRWHRVVTGCVLGSEMTH